MLLHAITDAVLGAAALGDIGMHFPDTDPQWKGATSDLFLEHAVALAREAGFELVNVDATVILERPKLKDYRQVIREGVARLAGLGPTGYRSSSRPPRRWVRPAKAGASNRKRW